MSIVIPTPAMIANRTKIKTASSLVASPAKVSSLEALLPLIEPSAVAARGRPLVLVSTASVRLGTRVHVEDLLDDVRERADVVIMRTAALGHELGEARPRLRCSGGALRVFFPDGMGSKALLVGQEEDSDSVLDRLDELLHDWERRRSRASQPMPEASPSAPSADLQQATTEALDRVDLDVAHVEQRPASERVACQSCADLRLDVSSLENELESLRASNRELRAENRALEQRLSQVITSSPPPLPIVHSDPGEQFGFEIQHHFLVSTPQAQREEHPLRAFRLGPDFLSSLACLGALATRERVVQVVCEVLTRAAFSMPARAVHPHRPAGAGNVVRERDGATAYRCAVKVESPGAARLLWWELTDGGV